MQNLHQTYINAFENNYQYSSWTDAANFENPSLCNWLQRRTNNFIYMNQSVTQQISTGSLSEPHWINPNPMGKIQ